MIGRRALGRTAAAAALAITAATPAVASGAARPAATAGLHLGSPAAVTAVTTPVLSIRRVPDWLETTVAQQRLAARLDPTLAALQRARASTCLIVRQGSQTVFSLHPTQEVLPASNMKLLTMTAVLDKLGTKLTLDTDVTASRRPKGGTLSGNLYLIGHGDPLLRTPQYLPDLDEPEPVYTSLPGLAAKVRAAGITKIEGSVIGDESYFDTQRAVPTWKPSYTEDEDVGPLSALEVNDGFSLTTPAGPAALPATMAASVFTALLKKDGVTVTGRPGQGRSPARAVPVTSIASVPMGQLIGIVLRVSDDTGAELLLKQLGRRVAGVGSTAAGLKVVRADLAHDGLPVNQLEQYDGSGLDTRDRVTCNLILDDLDYEGTGGALFAGLPIAGETGTLVTLMNGTPAAGRVHAKTGTLDAVSALSGWVMPPAGHRAPTPALGAPLSFSLIINNTPDVYDAQQVEAAIGVDLAKPLAVPPLSAAVPHG